MEAGIAVEAAALFVLPYSKVSSAPVVENGILSARFRVLQKPEHDLVLRYAKKADARAFANAVNEAWRAFNILELEREGARIDSVLAELASLEVPRCYPSACATSKLLSDAHDLETRITSKLVPEAVGDAAMERVAPISRFVTDPVSARAGAVERFVAAELDKWREFLDTVESKPLTPEQRLSVVVDEDATLVLAGAGSGKTSVITAKAAYLLKSGIRTADQILLLAFAKDAAAEMSERIEARCGAPIEARTFHALAYDIIGSVEGAKPPLAAHATDDAAFVAMIRDILRELALKASAISKAIIEWFSHFLIDPPPEQDVQTKHDWYAQVEKMDLRTLQGEQVKSYEELQIANWLYINGIAYEYEPVYPHAVSTDGRRVYTPDFRLTESGVFLEHFGVQKKRLPDGREELVTARHIDRDDYIAGMEWKRQVHADHGTTLVETYSYERSEGRLLDALATKLVPHVTLAPRAPETIFDRVIELGHVDGFSRMLGTFLRQFKSGGYQAGDCASKAEGLKLGHRGRAFMAVFEPVYQEYQRRLGDHIDFEDMILRAARYAEEGRYTSPFRHILVDEFQDISQSRARLIKALKAQHPNARLFAVGDDWQSIYRFAGSDIHVMRNFGAEFGGRFASQTGVHRTVDLGRTFRSVDKIALAARQFVLRNPAQITKAVVPAGKATEPAIRIVWTGRDHDEKLREQLRRLSGLPAPDGRKTSVLLLGRYRFIDPGIRDLQRQFPALSLSFKTIHGSKGLEADHVILLRGENGRMGFPSEITDDPLLSLVSPEAEPFENAEERRVMYVAMTRARHTLTILASEAKPSSFVQELLADPAYETLGSNADASPVHACGECGGRLLRTQSGERVKFRCEHDRLCGNLVPACSSCGVGLPVKQVGHEGMRCPQCTTSFASCPSCADGWLVKRPGRFGDFLGCVRFPECKGKPRRAKSASSTKRQPVRKSDSA